MSGKPIKLAAAALLLVGPEFCTTCSAGGPADHYGLPVPTPRPWAPPAGVPWKVAHWDVSSAAPTAIFDQSGRLTPIATYYFNLASDPTWFGDHLAYALDNPDWHPHETPTFKGQASDNMSVLHRALASLKAFVDTARKSPAIDPAFKARLFTPAWRDRCEQIMRDALGPRGLLKRGDHELPVAQAFHLLRSTLQDGRERGDFLREEQVWTLEHAQQLVRAVLTDPDIVSPANRWLSASPAVLAQYGARQGRADAEQAPPAAGGEAGQTLDAVRVQDHRVFYSGGLFIGWETSHPSLHATWDVLAIINILYSHYPQPDPSQPDSVFGLWYRQSPEARRPGVDAMRLLSRRLWLDYAEHAGPSWCRVSGGEPTESVDSPSEAGQLADHAGYTLKDRTHWAFLAWQEMFGRPRGPGCDGVQALLAICDGRVWSSQSRRWPRPGTTRPTGTGH